MYTARQSRTLASFYVRELHNNTKEIAVQRWKGAQETAAVQHTLVRVRIGLLSRDQNEGTQSTSYLRP